MARRKTGSIRKKRDGVYQVAVDLSNLNRAYLANEALWGGERLDRVVVKNDTGGRRRHYETMVGTREDAERRLRELLFQADTGALPTGNTTLNVWMDYWLREYIVPDRRTRTVDDYRRQVRVHIAPALGSMHLAAVRPHHIREFLNRKDRQLSRSSVGKLHQILSGAFKEAWRNDLIPDNPVAKVDRLSAKPTRVEAPLTMDRVQQIIAGSEAKGERFAVLFRLLAFTGLRIGEALALEWQHVDFVGRRVLVRQTTTFDNDRITIGPPKSEKGVRDVPILDDGLIAALLKHREVQDAMRERMGERYHDRGLVFPKVRPNQAGNLLANRQVQQTLARYGTHPHALRHFFGTQMFEAGASLLRVSLLMGHANINITASIYLHPDEAGNREAVDLFTARMQAANGGAMAAEAVESLLADMQIGV